jgi:hypothetical protein
MAEQIFPSDGELVVQRALIHGPSVMDEVSGYPEETQKAIFSKKSFENPDDRNNFLITLGTSNETPSADTTERFTEAMQSLGLSEVAPSVYAVNLQRAVHLERKRRGLTQEAVAHQVGLYPTAVSSFIRGKRVTPYMEYKMKKLFEGDSV